MASIAPPLPRKKPEPTHDSGGGNNLHAVDWGGGDSSGGAALPDRRYYTGMLLGLGGVIMLFAAFTSALVVRKGLSDDWQPVTLPGILWVNTLVLLASSGAIEKARRGITDPARIRLWWGITTALGLAFLAGQYLAWMQLSAAGVFIATNPSSSFFYLLTGAHGLHLLGGVTALLYLGARLWNGASPSATALGVTALYWHFMDGLWIYLLLLLLVGGR